MAAWTHGGRSSAGGDVRSADRAFDCALLVAVCVLAVLVFRDYGISNDEEVQHRYGELIVEYYASGFRDDRAVQLQESLSVWRPVRHRRGVARQDLPFDIFLIRHLLSALIGVAGIGAAWATARLIAGPRAGLIALVSLAVCGPYFGGMFNHTKDVPFAAAMMGAVYFLLRAARDLPAPRWAHLLGFGLMLGAATGLRAMGLLLVGYAALLIVMSVLASLASRASTASPCCIATRLRYFIPALLLGYRDHAVGLALGVACAAQSAARDLFLRAFPLRDSHHRCRRNLQDGAMCRGGTCRSISRSRRRLSCWPARAFASRLYDRWRWCGTGRRLPRRQLETGFVIFVAIFPVLCEAIAEGPAFTGMRHFLFVVPPLAVLAGIGFDAALVALSARRWLAVGAAAALSRGIALECERSRSAASV